MIKKYLPNSALGSKEEEGSSKTNKSTCLLLALIIVLAKDNRCHWPLENLTSLSLFFSSSFLAFSNSLKILNPGPTLPVTPPNCGGSSSVE